MKSEVEVSVIVASHRPDYVGGLAALLTAAATCSVPTEVIIVTDFCFDTLPHDYPLIHWVFLNNRSISAKRNKGISLSKGRFIAFIDDDCRPSKDWIQKGYTFLATNSEYVGVEGLTSIASPIEAKEKPIRDYKRLENPGYRTNNIFYRAEKIKEVGCFDERFTVQREDVDLAFSLIEKGYRIGFSPEIKISHMVRSGEWWDLLKNCWNRRFDPLLSKKHPVLYRKQLGYSWSGSIFINGVLTAASFFLLIVKNNKKVLALPILSSILFSVRRRRDIQIISFRCAAETVSFLIAPFVLLAALAYGSLRYRIFFLC